MTDTLTPQRARKTEGIHRTGLSTDRPLAPSVLPGTLYYSTDLQILEQSDGAAWTSYSFPPTAVPYVFYYRATTSSTSANDPGAGNIRWNNANQQLATSLYVDVLTSRDFDAVLFYETVGPQDEIIIQDQDTSQNYQQWKLTGAVLKQPDWFIVPVALVGSGGVGSMPNNAQVAVIIKMGGNTTSANAAADVESQLRALDARVAQLEAANG